jgi:uncharacterized protein (DUF1778 family)
VSTSKKQSARVNLRIAPGIKANLSKAAEASGQTLTDFVVESAVTSAESVLAGRTRFSLSPKNWRKFNELLDSPPRQIPALKRLLREKSVFEKA